MAARSSRRKIALFAADELVAGSETVLSELAALLVAERRISEVDLIVRDIEAELALRGVVIADVTSAHPLNAAMRQRVADFLQADTVHIRENISPSVRGGIKIETPSQLYDGTIEKKLSDLRAQKV